MQQHVIVARAHHGVDRDDGVAAGTIFHHHGDAPARAQPICQQPRADIDPGAGTERHDESDRSLRPALLRHRRRSLRGLRRRGRRRQDERRNKAQGEQRTLHAMHGLLPAIRATMAHGRTLADSGRIMRKVDAAVMCHQPRQFALTSGSCQPLPPRPASAFGRPPARCLHRLARDRIDLELHSSVSARNSRSFKVSMNALRSKTTRSAEFREAPGRAGPSAGGRTPA